MIHDADQLLGLAKDWLKQGNTTVAFQLLNEANKINDSHSKPIIKGEISKEIGRVHMQTGQWRQAEDAFNQATGIFLEHEFYKGAAESIRNLANMKFQQGLFKDSYNLCEKAVGYATNSGDFQLRATILNTQGAIRSIEGKYLEAIKVFKLCLSDFRRVGNGLRQAYVQHNIGLAQLELGTYEESRKSLEDALVLALSSGDANLVEICYQNMAKLQLKLGDLSSAHSLIRAAGNLLDNLKSPQLTVDLALVEAELYRLSGDLKEAENILKSALQTARTGQMLQHAAEILYELGQLALNQGESVAARRNLEEASALFKKTGSGKIETVSQKLKNLKTKAKKGIKT